MTPIAREDLYALLEDGPHPLDELAGWLERTVDDVRQALPAAGLKVCERCDRAFIPSRGGAGRYCTQDCYRRGGPGTRAITRNGGRKAWVDHEARRAAILQVLKDKRPRLIGDLVAATGLTLDQAQLACRELRTAGRIMVVVLAAAKHWALPTWMPAPGPITAKTPAAPPPPSMADADLAEELEGDDVEPVDEDLDDVDDVEELPTPAQRVKDQRTLYPRSTNTAGAPLRQPKPAVAADPAWWIAAPRDGFSDVARQRQDRMSKVTMHLTKAVRANRIRVKWRSRPRFRPLPPN